jgi:hypothetical protein
LEVARFFALDVCTIIALKNIDKEPNVTRKNFGVGCSGQMSG